MRISTPNRDTYVYPDAIIVCGKPELEDDQFDTLLNPSVVFEILSPSTSKKDVGYKLIYYKNIPSLLQYVMIHSKKKYIQTVNKQPGGAWRFQDITNPTTKLGIPAINFSISPDDIYRNTDL